MNPPAVASGAQATVSPSAGKQDRGQVTGFTEFPLETQKASLHTALLMACRKPLPVHKDGQNERSQHCLSSPPWLAAV